MTWYPHISKDWGKHHVVKKKGQGGKVPFRLPLTEGFQARQLLYTSKPASLLS